VTHFLPTYAAISPVYRQLENTDLNYYFSSSCDDILSEYKINAWVSGHTHIPYDMEVYDTRLLCNPIGYPNENKHFIDEVVDIV
jgi:hypothetical protein